MIRTAAGHVHRTWCVAEAARQMGHEGPGSSAEGPDTPAVVQRIKSAEGKVFFGLVAGALIGIVLREDRSLNERDDDGPFVDVRQGGVASVLPGRTVSAEEESKAADSRAANENTRCAFLLLHLPLFV